MLFFVSPYYGFFQFTLLKNYNCDASTCYILYPTNTIKIENRALLLVLFYSGHQPPKVKIFIIFKTLLFSDKFN